MFLVTRSTSFRFPLISRYRKTSAFLLSLKNFSRHPNPPLDLDPSLQALLKDVDISLSQHKSRPPVPRRELEALPTEGLPETDTSLEELPEHTQRKSPAAQFGSQQIGAVELPPQLQTSINLLIFESDRVQLHSDAKRLFYDDELGKASDDEWETQYNSKYRSRRQAARHAERDGTAFASIALPAHYSAIFSVFDHLKRRLGPTWKIERIIDWGAGTGSGLWASLYSFQKPLLGTNGEGHGLNSTISTYLGIDKRDGLVSIGKRLLRNVDLGSLSVSWQRSFKDEDRIPRSNGHDAIALSAFMLTSLSTPLARKALVKEMWESGAHVMVLIDHYTTAGFEAIAEARQYLLDMGRKEFEDSEADLWPIRGSHVIAPCPHDGACPLHHPGSNRLLCGFTQRWQRPSFVRLTKHSGVGHEDIEYSYVVIRRGSRPSPATTNYGRIGDVGKRALDREILSQVPVKELQLHHEYEEAKAGAVEVPVPNTEVAVHVDQPLEPPSGAELEAALRLEAYSWPRLVFPPLKKSGHIILDSCTAEGKIMRLTIPKSQGKQAYYDARKSGWGDIFPHPPKNPPQERHQPSRIKRDGGYWPYSGADIGKRSNLDRKRERVSYDVLSKALKARRKDSRRDRAAAKQE